MARDIRTALEDFLRMDGVQAAVLVGRDGFLIESAVLGKQVDLEGLGAVVATALGSSEVIGDDLDMGGLELHMLEFDKGRVVIASTSDQILALVADPTAVLGSVRRAAMKGVKDLVKLL